MFRLATAVVVVVVAAIVVAGAVDVVVASVIATIDHCHCKRSRHLRQCPFTWLASVVAVIVVVDGGVVLVVDGGVVIVGSGFVAVIVAVVVQQSPLT